MGKGRPRAVEKLGLGQATTVPFNGSLNVPQAPVYYPTEEEFRDPLEFIYKIREEAEVYGICRIVPPKSWNPTFALKLDTFEFPTKTQAIHQLQARVASCDGKTFGLEYGRFLEGQYGRKVKRKKVVFEGEDLDLCRFFNAVKRFGGYDKVVEGKKWGEVARFVRSTGGGKGKISECAKHVLSQLYLEHLYDYESYYNKLNDGKGRNHKKSSQVVERKTDRASDSPCGRKRRKSNSGASVEVNHTLEERFDQICEQCKSGLHAEVMLLCDRCNKGWHMYCLSPPLEAIPPGNWYCFECLNSDKDSFGFVPGRRFSLESFRKVADRTKKKWLGASSFSHVQIEKKFWEIVEGSLGEVEVKYGSDIDTSIYGSGFPRVNDQRPESIDPAVWDEYCASPWNLNNLPKLKGSMLRAVHHNIAGVMVPWLYMGMLFSAFCWHFEDHCFYSMNYHHWGEPKLWYSVPGSKASAFEKVMRSCLPDLFDAQPDLLFQLVTMLNPSVLLQNKIPVYSVIQEPGNFVITFPRSYHSGFNLGLNCAEAVNFAPADWLPHGGFGAELYQLYRKAAVLSHEELLCVVAKNSCNSKALPYLKKELLRIYSKEKTWRERLWKKGIVRSSVMPHRKHPEHVGTEEDPTCIICQQYLYLSAIVCRCRRSKKVCLEHWEHLCECNPRKRHLLFRHSLAELNQLVVMAENSDDCCASESRSRRRHQPCSSDSVFLTKKVNGKKVTFAQVAEEWLLSSCKITQLPFSGDAYDKALRKAEQFIWAGEDMDPVRDMVKNMVDAKNWGESVEKCVLRIESWSLEVANEDKVHLDHITTLLRRDPAPCDVPGHLKLKEHAEAAMAMAKEIQDALSKASTSMSEMEDLDARALNFPIHVKESEELQGKISSLKLWIDTVRKCSNGISPAIDISILYRLRIEMQECHLHLPESEMLLQLIGRAELCQTRCRELLKRCISLKELKELIHDFESLMINISELELLRQCYSDALSWVSRFNRTLENVQDREDQENIIDELKCLQKGGALLKVQVDELSLVEVELRKAYCRDKALKAQASKMPLDFIEQVLSEADELQIEKEKHFESLSEVCCASLNWENHAKQILAAEASMADFEDAIRSAADIFATLPSFSALVDAITTAKMWLEKSLPYLRKDDHSTSSSKLLCLDSLKEQVSVSKLLKVHLDEKMMIQTILTNLEEWKHDAGSCLEDADKILNFDSIEDQMSSDVAFRIKELVTEMERVIAAGLSLRFDFPELPMLQNSYSVLHWCSRVFSFQYIAASIEEVNGLSTEAKGLPMAYGASSLLTSLISGVTWLNKASEVLFLLRSGRRLSQLSDAEGLLLELQNIKVQFPAMVGQLKDSIAKHKAWQDKVQSFLCLNEEEQSHSSLLQLKELGITNAFNCPEMDKVMSEIESVENWRARCCQDVGSSDSGTYSLSTSLVKIKQSLHRSMYIYEKLKCCKIRYFCIGCSMDSDDQEYITCSSCKDCYHLKCLVPTFANTKVSKEYICPYCLLVESGSICRSGDSPLKYSGKRPELKKLIEMSSAVKKFRVWLEEREILQEIVDQALACRDCLDGIVDSALSYLGEDVSSIASRLTIALKALDVVGFHDPLAGHKFDLALARHSWRVRVIKLFESSTKPVIQQIQRHLKEASTIKVPSEDHYMIMLLEIKQTGMQWAETAKKVAADNGELELEQVFELIEAGEKLPIRFTKELKLLQDRSMLYCICRKPYDQRAMIACDKCDEWYHFDCINLVTVPKVYICPACEPFIQGKADLMELVKPDRSAGKDGGEPQTPSPRNMASSRWKSKKAKACSADRSSSEDGFSGIDGLFWRSRKPFRRTAKKRADLGTLTLFPLL
ncbi:hypothetical protein Droror1_Dr00005377 [Drosera rotundifolia]